MQAAVVPFENSVGGASRSTNRIGLPVWVRSEQGGRGDIGVYNPSSQQHETFALKGDKRARQRLKIKSKAQIDQAPKRRGLGD